ncbi:MULTISPECIES: PAS domain S-box protein [Bradyrhizobium]|jgi:PAS domain S-box-containing protein|uniref:histidine kinase n=1 Tax=Bradyrhizobium ottawaense TaxID=931866 RepID=A0A2U8PDV9_9BRAD|nr:MULTISPECIES: PAS domain S-box protein [Bradyrhizobium]AWL95952.1 PAS domain-containing sensor histidine kinase [Bradyrhizobium ottawaense]MBR1324330.1 PAS domain S-box protein [Bradyrhizobium ottawaense]MBR1337178.1 PAS domain S-box protein [Bradyrhizobium ottawaense]MBR1365443.1 PAS domain S-box protein [Bradyrhizobium ottawaense]MDA9446652.1 ATPase [Bradyrhizobium sp. CCBAU 21360]
MMPGQITKIGTSAAQFLLGGLAALRSFGNGEKDRSAVADASRQNTDLRDAMKQWREVFEHNPVMYFMVDPSGTVLNVNTFGAAQLGYSTAELIGQSVLNVFFEEDHDFVRQCVALCLTTVDQSHTWEIRKFRKDGSVLWVRENAKAMLRGDGTPILLVACENITQRKEAEDALRQSEAYLAQAQELSHTGSFGLNLATGEAVWSRETFRIFQCDPATKPTLNFAFQRIHPEDRDIVRGTLDRAYRLAEDFDHEYRLLMPDGSIKYLHSVARAVRHPSGRIEFVGAVTDVTIAKEAEQRLRRSEAYLAEAQRLSHTSSWAWDVHRQEFAYRSAELYRLFGFELDQTDVPARAFQQRILPEDFRRIVEVEREAVRQKQPFQIDFRIVRPDGSIRHVHSEGHPVIGRDGEVMEIIGTHVDVTEQFAAKDALHQAFDELKTSEQRFRDYAETASDWFWETGPDHRITRISEHAETSSAAPKGLIGLARWDIPPDAEFEPEKWEQHRAALDAHVAFRDLIYRSRDGNGSPIYVRTSGKPFHDATGNFLGYRGVSSDVTAAIRVEQAEEALRKAQGELAHVTRVTTLGELTTSIAHEITQPIAAVISNADACIAWLDRDPADLKAARRSAEWIVEDANRASEVIRRIRALAKKTEIEMAPLDINQVVREAVALVRRELAIHAVSVRMELASDLPRICGDRIQLQQVLINLVVNGIEAMHANVDRPRELAIRSSRTDDDRLLLTVTDRGVGLGKDVKERIFTPFFTTKSGGLGMGLSICRSIIEAHAGRLSAIQNEGSGATFQIALPLPHKDTS